MTTTETDPTPTTAPGASRPRLSSYLDDFAGQRVLVVGDIMLDRYVHARVDRLNPEAPAPLLDHEMTVDDAGGAANAARQLTVLGAEVTLVGVVGQDEDGDQLAALIVDNPMVQDLVCDPTRGTTVKTRYLVDDRQLLRIDREDTRRIMDKVEDDVVELIRAHAADGLDGILVSDYAKGVITPRVATAIMAARAAHGLTVVADVKPANAGFFLGVDAITPNLREALQMLRHPFLTADEDWPAIAARLEAKFDTNVYLTLAEQGIYVHTDHWRAHVRPERQPRVADVSGCGDTASAVILLARLCGVTAFHTARLANMAGGLAAEQVGAAAITTVSLRRALQQWADVPSSR